jgi:RHS repeat-associated protein
MISGRYALIRRLFCLSVLLWLSASAAASARYRVSLTLYPGDDAAAVARQVALTYGGRLEEGSPGQSVTMELSEATAALAARDPRVESLEVVSEAEATWSRGTYRYDGSGNISQIGDEDYRYDPTGRLVYGDAGAGANQSYTYDAFGNVLTIDTVEPGQATVQSRLAVDPATNQIDKPDADDNVVGTYDLSGNLTSYNGTTILSYDALNVVKEATVPGVAGRRVFLYTAGDERIATINVLGTTVTETEWTLRDASGKVLRRVSKTPTGPWRWEEDYIYRGSQLLAAEVADNRRTLRFHLDHLGTPHLITANGGVEVGRPRYFAFGQEVRATADGEPMKFTGHERDGRSLDYMHARYYDPLMGRFVSVDPVSSVTLALVSPQAWNRYTYVRNNPLGAFDPDGMQEVKVTFPPPKPETLARYTPEMRAAENLKNAELAAAADAGELTVTSAGRRGGLRALWTAAFGPVGSEYDIDHVRDLGLGGADDLPNARPSPRTVNRSHGARMGNITRKLTPGTRITSFSYTTLAVVNIAGIVSDGAAMFSFHRQFKAKYGRDATFGEFGRFLGTGVVMSDEQARRQWIDAELKRQKEGI